MIHQYTKLNINTPSKIIFFTYVDITYVYEWHCHFSDLTCTKIQFVSQVGEWFLASAPLVVQIFSYWHADESAIEHTQLSYENRNSTTKTVDIEAIHW